MKAATLSDAEGRAALALSDAVNLNELSAASIIVDIRTLVMCSLMLCHVVTSPQSDGSPSLLGPALCLYHDCKTALLDALHVLLVARQGRTYEHMFSQGM